MKVRDVWVKGIPITEYLPESQAPRGLFFVVHGHKQDRKNGLEKLCKVLTCNHYLAVSIDAYKHGERLAEPYVSGSETEMYHEMPKVVYQTIQDIKTLYQEKYQQDFSSYGITGFSMGGHLAYYAPMFLSNIHTIIPIGGSANLLNHYRFSVKKRISEYDESILDLFLNAYDINKYLNINVLMLHGRMDMVVLPSHAAELNRQLKALNHPDVTFIQLECGHILADEMLYAMNLYLRMHPSM